MFIPHWTVDYGDGSQPIVLPHAWGQDVSLQWEGPAVYRTQIDLPRIGGTLRFHGVSYAAEVYANGLRAARHEGIWDAFDVALPGGKVEVEVRVFKNGGATHPVRETLAGFLPYVYGTFGGIYREVELLDRASPSLVEAQDRIASRSRRPYIRGILHQGWYPEIGHPNPDEHTIRKEVREAKAMGFNLVKFGLWVPPHRYLDILQEEGMLGWLELPLWNPTPEKLGAMADEIERIVLQYRHHPSLIVWSIGGGFAEAVPHGFRRDVVEMVRALTGCPDVVDGLGGTETSGDDLREYGTLDSFHPLCDLPFFPPVLDELRDGQRGPVLGETNDHDVHRDLARLGDELPYWASALPELNARGVRARDDLPSVLDTARFAIEPTKNRHKALMESSRRKALFVRKTVTEAIRARTEIDGYVVSGLRDTPISSSGLFDDWGSPRFTSEECLPWNGGGVLFPIPTRCLAWTNGGRRPGWLDPLTHFAGDVFLRLGADGDDAGDGFEPESFYWRIADERGVTVARGASMGENGRQGEWARAFLQDAPPGEYRLEARSGAVTNAWPLGVVERPDWATCEGWGVHDPGGLIPELAALPGGAKTVAVRRLAGEGGVLLLDEEGTIPMPFWRECAQEFADPTMERWERLLPVSPDRALDPAWLRERFGDYEVLMNRIDTRTYAEHPLLVRAGSWVVTTLRPQGGLGSQPPGLGWNPAGCALLRSLMSMTTS